MWAAIIVGLAAIMLGVYVRWGGTSSLGRQLSTMLLLGGSVLAVWGWGSDAPPPRPPTEDAPARPVLHIGATTRTMPGHVACTTVWAVKRALTLSVDHDMQALATFVGTASNGCLLLRGGDVVVVEGYPEIGLVQFRPKGDPTSAYAVAEALSGSP